MHAARCAGAMACAVGAMVLEALAWRLATPSELRRAGKSGTQ